MGYIGRQPTNAILTSDDIAAGSVSKDKVNLISNGTAGLTVKGDNGSNDGYLQLNCRVNSHGIKLKSPPHSAGQSYTLTFPQTAPATDKFLQTDSSGNLSFADAGGNTPAFAARMSSAQTISNNTLTKIDFDTEEFDSDGAYDHSTNQRFTVPSGKAGKYVFYTSAILDAASHTQLQRCRIAIYKNGSMIKMRAVNFNSNDIYYMQLDISAALDLSVGDYIEAYARINDDSGNPVIDGSATENSTFYGYRLAWVI